MDKPNHYYQHLTMDLVEQIPADALRIIEIGCAEGKLGQFLKQQNPDRYIVGFEYVAQIADIAKQHLDEVYAGDIQKNPIPSHLQLGSFDCILCGDVLEHMPEATQVLKKLSPYLKPDGCVIACIPNTQHFSVLQQILTQNFQYHTTGLLDKTHINLMTLPNIFKMFLDAGFLPSLKHIKKQNPIDPDFMEALKPALKYLGVGFEQSKLNFEAFQYIVVAKLHQTSKQRTEKSKINHKDKPVSVISAVNNQLQFQNNLNISPDLHLYNHQMICVTDAQNINEAWQMGLAHAQHDWIVFTHQDVYLPEGWFKQIQYAWIEAEEKLSQKIAIAGVAGIKNQHGKVSVKASCIDRIETLSSDPTELPCAVDSLDELVLIFRKDRHLPDIHPELGFHFYATDMILKIQEQGFVAAVLDVPCLHNSSQEIANIDHSDLIEKAQIFHQLWQHKLPIETMCASFQQDQILMK